MPKTNHISCCLKKKKLSPNPLKALTDDASKIKKRPIVVRIIGIPASNVIFALRLCDACSL
jgi:hypothetical protein